MSHMKTGMTIGKRLALAFGAVIALMVGVTAIGMNRVVSISSVLTSITDVNAVKQRYAINFRGSVHDRAISLRDVVLVPDSELAGVTADITRLEGFYAESAEKLDRMFASGEGITQDEKDILASIKNVEATTQPIVRKVIDARKAGNADAAHQLLLAEAGPAFTVWLREINRFIDLQESRTQQQTAVVRGVAEGFSLLMVALCALAIALGAAIAFGITRHLLRAIGGEPAEAVNVISRIAQGDLHTRVPVSPPGSMLAAVATMQEKLRVIFAEVVASAGTLSENAMRVGNVSREAQSAAAEQAESSAVSAVSIEQMKSSIQEVSAIANQTEINSTRTSEMSEAGARLVRTAAEEIERVALTVQESSSKINGLEKRSHEIGGIAQVIKEIADQTNLLALNAAIEAARAGESGRGFAVVADEVRKLAERTAGATAEIAAVIALIQKDTGSAVEAMERAAPQVTKGLNLANEANTLLTEIHRQAVDSLQNVKSVVDAAQQQVVSAAEISGHVSRIAEMSEHTSASMRDSVSAAHELERISRTLKEHVSRFRLD